MCYSNSINRHQTVTVAAVVVVAVNLQQWKAYEKSAFDKI
jgi:hypothetical protein